MTSNNSTELGSGAPQDFVSWYKPRSPLDKTQKDYIALLRSTFRIKNAYGKWLPYVPLPYQEEYHSNFLVCNDRKHWRDRIVRKGRGIGFTVSTMMDMIMACLKFDDISIPVVSHRDLEARKLIVTAQKLVENALWDLEPVLPFTATSLRFKNGSQIEPYPAGSVDAVRSNRAPLLYYDEMEYYDHPDELLQAGGDIMSEGGQMTIGSTCKSRSSLFWILWNKANQEKLDWAWFDFPIFNRELFLREKNILKQIEEGLEPLGWWYDFKKLEERRSRDIISFLQENMCIPADEGSSFLGWDHIIDAMDNSHRIRAPFATEHYRTLGIDFARKVDQSAWSIVDWIPQGAATIKKQRWWTQFTGMSTPKQIDFGTSLINEWGIGEVRIDMGGNGLGLFEGLEDIFGSRIKGFNSARSSLAGKKEIINDEVEGVVDEWRRKYKTEVKRVRNNWKLATNLKRELQDRTFELIYDEVQAEQMNSVDHELKAPKTVHGHADIFWANALAIIPTEAPVQEIQHIGYLEPLFGTRFDRLPKKQKEHVMKVIEINKTLVKQGVLRRAY